MRQRPTTNDANNTYVRDNLKLKRVKVVHVQKTGRRGRPKKIISRQFLEEAFDPRRRLNQSSIGRSIKVGRHTVRKYRKLYGISNAYANITNAELDRLVQEYKAPLPRNGWRYVIAHLALKGFKVQVHRVKESLKRVDRLGIALRQRRGIKRRDYTSKRPNYLWHCDGHHKLIRWGIVIHGCADGNDRMVSTISWALITAEQTIPDSNQCCIVRWLC